MTKIAPTEVIDANTSQGLTLYTRVRLSQRTAFIGEYSITTLALLSFQHAHCFLITMAPEYAVLRCSGIIAPISRVRAPAPRACSESPATLPTSLTNCSLQSGRVCFGEYLAPHLRPSRTKTQCSCETLLAGRKAMSLHSASAMARDGVPLKARAAARDGLPLNAAVACEDHQREKIERLCRYFSTGPIALDRLGVDGDGLVV